MVGPGQLLELLGAVGGDVALQDGVDEAENLDRLCLGELGDDVTVTELPGIPADQRVQKRVYQGFGIRLTEPAGWCRRSRRCARPATW